MDLSAGYGFGEQAFRQVARLVLIYFIMYDVTHLRFGVSLFPRRKGRWSLPSIPARRALAHFEYELAAPAELIVRHPASIELLSVECYGLGIIFRIRNTRRGDVEPRLLRCASEEPNA